MGDELVELDLDFGGVVGEENNNRGPADASNHDPFFDVDDDFEEGDVDNYDDDPQAEVLYDYADEAAGGVKEEDEDDEGYYQPPSGQNEVKSEEDTDNDVDVDADAHNHADEDDNDNSSMQNKKLPAKIYQPPSLLHLTMKLVASNLEKYPPGAIGLLSLPHWEGVVRARVANKKESSKIKPQNVIDPDKKSWTTDAKPIFALDSKSEKKMLPALNERFLRPIETHSRNVHLSKCRVADVLFWKAIVDYNFGGMNRPVSLKVPCDVLKERLRGLGEKLVGLMECPMSFEDYVREFGSREEKNQENDQEGEFKAVKEGGSGHKQKREEGMAELFGDESDQEGDVMNEEAEQQNKMVQEAKSKEDSPDMEAYHQYLHLQSHEQTYSLCHILHSLQQSPMDVTLLAGTEVGKCAVKVIKLMKKLKKDFNESENESENEQMEAALSGYPKFWKFVDWSQQRTRAGWKRVYINDHLDEMTPLEFLQQLLQDWKDMASSASPHSKKRKHSEIKATSITIATFGKDGKMPLDQHQMDMKFLHSSPDWRSLYRTLHKRKDMVQKSHGDKVRSIKQRLEKDRAKIGKVVLKRAVGRVRGSGGGKQPSNMVVRGANAGQSLRGPNIGGALSSRKEAILSKSRGNKARSKQDPAAYSSGGVSGKMSQIRRETNVIAGIAGRPSAMAKSSSFGASIAKASFGASVAGVVGKGSARKPRPTISVQLKGGRQMKLPQQSTVRGTAKKATAGIFSSLQQKEQVKNQKVRAKEQKEKVEVHRNKMQKLRRQQRQQTQHRQMLKPGQQEQRPASVGGGTRERSTTPSKQDRRGGGGPSQQDRRGGGGRPSQQDRRGGSGGGGRYY